MVENSGKQEIKLETVIITKKDGVATVTMNRPEKLNAVSPELGRDLLQAIDDVASDEAIKSAILTGAGKSFSAGGDVKRDIAPLQEMSSTEFNAYFSDVIRMYKSLIDIEKPIIAAINGYAIGAGMDLALCCDIRIAAEDAQMGEFFIRMGLTPEVAPYLLPRLIGLSRAKMISLLGDTVNAKEAKQIGLVDEVVPLDKLTAFAGGLAKRLANGPEAVGAIKKAFNRSLTMNFEESMDYITLLQYQLVHTDDHKEAVKAFLGKRKPVFKGGASSGRQC